MQHSAESRQPKQHSWTPGRAAASVRCGTAGVLGALICWFTCCLPPILVALGAGVSTSAGMAGMGHARTLGGTPGSIVDLLNRFTPGLLIASIVLITGAFALRRPAAAIPALLAGVAVYVSVHAQPDPVVMYAGMAVGYGTWIGLYIWTRPGRSRRRRSDNADRQASSPAQATNRRGRQEAQ